MTEEKNTVTIVEKAILQKIVVLRNEKVILDVHLAELYGVETRTLKQAVRRNIERFPADDFMFELTEDEIAAVVSQNVIPHRKYLGGANPFAFTETGVAMLSSVLKSKAAVEMNIAIIRTFVALRKVASNYKEIMEILMEMRSLYDAQFEEVYSALEKLINPPPQEPRPRIGFRRGDEID
ncbi:ORF6N domain-containing protein [Flavitalea sp. BT771]|uniref:ORF6N domain-containing protein n=1 Tax=Flavitalea sp. BT771 TaxID=3063329 RepID=UPI0026E2B83A|nr:ORF6N domain-containing protein [Flavitalea sp. BT771]MDO6432770.1 ORF6N domain-containing protein [Flavitalea sp. BT771]MDV6221954.1 ORF6N domain-containing protein [Flavitalea sp. BT771]